MALGLSDTSKLGNDEKMMEAMVHEWMSE